MPSWLLVVGGVVLVGWIADRLPRRAEANGWIFCRWRKPAPGTSATAVLTMQAMFQPPVQHVVESVSVRVGERRDDQGEGFGPRGARS